MSKKLGVVAVLVAAGLAVIFLLPSMRARVLGVPLKVRFSEGSEIRTKMNVDGTVKVEASGLPDGALPKEVVALLNQDISFRVETRLLQQVKRVSGETAQLESRSEGGSCELRLPGVEQPVHYDVPAGPATTLEVDAQGRVSYDLGTAPAALSPRDAQKMQEFLGALSSAYLPGTTKRVGESWSIEPSLPLKGRSIGALVSGEVQSSFTGVSEKNGFTVADISSVQTLDLKAARHEADVDFALTGNLQTKTHTYFDFQAGQTVASDSDAALDLTLTVKMAKPQATQVRAHLTGKAHVTLERL